MSNQELTGDGHDTTGRSADPTEAATETGITETGATELGITETGATETGAAGPAGPSSAGPSDRERALFDLVRSAQDTLTVRRVFGEPYESNGVTFIPVARVIGGGGGGSGEGTGTEGTSVGTGSGSGSGFGLRAYPVGAYVVRNGEVSWQPSIDATRLLRGLQVLAGLVIISRLIGTRRVRSIRRRR